MKQTRSSLYLLLLCIIFSINVCAQAPQAIPYQAVARDTAGNLIPNQPISLRFSIRDGGVSGTIVYGETHTPTTNALGLVTVNIGQGAVVSGTFATINWGSGAKFLQVEMDVAGGSNYVNMGTQQMLSVPYALYAGSVASTDSSLTYIGSWNASTNTPSLTSSTGRKGDYYVVSDAGSTDLDGVNEWKTGDWAVYNGTVWQKVDNSDLLMPGTANGNTLRWNGTAWVNDSSLYNNGTSIGIGTTAPSTQLHTTGGVRFQSLSGSGYRQLYVDSIGNLAMNLPINQSNTTPATIPDNSCTGVVSTITLSGLPSSVASSSINVTVNIDHWNVAELKVYLKAPDNSIINLIHHNGGSGNNFTNTVFSDTGATALPTTSTGEPFTGTYKPTGDMATTCSITPTASTFSAIGGGVINPNGTWTLYVFDMTPPHPAIPSLPGTLENWSISLGRGLASGTDNYLTKWQNGNLSDSSQIYDDGSNVGIGTSTPTTQLHTTGGVRFQSLSGSGYRPLFVDSIGNLALNLPINQSNTTPAAIPDGGCTGTNSTITLSGLPSSVVSSSISVTVNISHTWVEDLRVYLKAPDNSIINLIYLNGGSGDNFTNTVFSDNGSGTLPATATGAPFTGTYKATGNMATVCSITPTASTFSAIGGGVINPNGTWTLYVFDPFSGDAGTLNNWSVSLERGLGSGTDNYLTKWQGGNLTERSKVYDNGTNVGVNTNTPTSTLDVNGKIRSNLLIGAGTRLVYADSLGNLTQNEVFANGTAANAPNASIPDNSCTGTTSTITLSNLPTTQSSNIAVTVNITHTWNSDLIVYLKSPDNSIINLIHTNGSSGDNFTNTIFRDNGAAALPTNSTGAPFTGTYKPTGNMTAVCTITPTVSTFSAIGGGTINPNGIWTLYVFDQSQFDSGALNNWSVSVNGSVTAGGQNNYLPKWNNGNLSNTSQIYEDGANVGIGTSSPAYKLDVVGGDASINEVLVGKGTSTRNTFVGNSSVFINNLGDGNSAFGHQALDANSSGALNCAFGLYALSRNQSGLRNVAVGSTAMWHNTSGNDNVAVGGGSLLNNDDGFCNSAFGKDALRFNYRGDSLTAIGSNADVLNSNLINATAIGANAKVATSNSLVLGASNVNVGIGTSSPSAKLDVIGSIKITDGTQGTGKVLTSNSGGLASWVTPTLSNGSTAGNTPYWNGTTWVSNSSNIFNNGGNVGIGLSNPAKTLDVNGAARINNHLIFNNSNGVINWGNTGSLFFRTNTTVGDEGTYIDRMIITNAGAVGIGTTSPAATFDIRNSSAAGDAIVSNLANGIADPLFSLTTRKGENSSANGSISTKIGLYYSTTENASIRFHRGTSTTGGFMSFSTNNGTERMRIDGNGFVGINTTNPIATLHVAPFSTTYSSLAITYFSYNIGLQTISWNPPGSVAAYFQGNIVSTAGVMTTNGALTTSDIRLKKIVSRSNSVDDLKILNTIKVTDYRFIDSLALGNVIQKKVIAQELEEVYPRAIKYNTDYIPSIYAMSDQVNYANDNLSVTLDKAHDLVKGDLIKWIDESGEMHYDTVRAVSSERTFEIDASKEYKKLFVWGKRVDDLRTVDYDALTMLNVSSTQQLYKLICKLQEENQGLKNQYKELKSENETFRSDIEKIKAQLGMDVKAEK